MKRITCLTLCLLLVICVLSAGCVDYNPEDKIYVDYIDRGYYYFVDDNYKSFYETLWQDDMGEYINLYQTPKEWVYYIQHMHYIDDGENEAEYFSSISETMRKNGGDCEDRSILMARMLYEYGYDSCVIVTKEHVLAGIKKSQFNYGKLQPLIHSSTRNLYDLSKDVIDYYIIECTASYPFGYYDEPELIIEKIYELNHGVPNPTPTSKQTPKPTPTPTPTPVSTHSPTPTSTFVPSVINYLGPSEKTPSPVSIVDMDDPILGRWHWSEGNNILTFMYTGMGIDETYGSGTNFEWEKVENNHYRDVRGHYDYYLNEDATVLTWKYVASSKTREYIKI